MILADQIKELEQRREALERCLGIDQKRIDPAQRGGKDPGTRFLGRARQGARAVAQGRRHQGVGRRLRCRGQGCRRPGADARFREGRGHERGGDGRPLRTDARAYRDARNAPTCCAAKRTSWGRSWTSTPEPGVPRRSIGRRCSCACIPAGARRTVTRSRCSTTRPATRWA